MRALVMALAVSLASTAASAQAPTPTPTPYEPKVGMPGKDVVWVPTPPELVAKMLDLAGLTPDDFVIDLGSGDGRNIIAAARRGARGLGVEFNPEMVELSRRLAAEAGVADKATFVQGDMFEADLSKATVLALYLLPENLNRLAPKFLTLKPGTRIVANTFGPEEWEPDAREDTEGLACSSWCEALLWIVPARVGGSWRLQDGSTLSLVQSYQRLTGGILLEDKVTDIANARMRGDQIRFEAGGSIYSGRVSGNEIEGTIRTALGERAWKATRVPQP